MESFIKDICRVGFSGKLANTFASFLFPILKYIFKNPNHLTLINLILSPLYIYFAYQNQYFNMGVLSIIIIVIDNMDGTLARKLNKCSYFGEAFDSVVDIFFYVIILYSGIVFMNESLFAIVMSLYIILSSIRISKMSLENRLTTLNKQFSPSSINNTNSIKLLIQYFTGYNDFIVLLGIILIFSPSNIWIWCLIESIKRFLNILLELRSFSIFLKQINMQNTN